MLEPRHEIEQFCCSFQVQLTYNSSCPEGPQSAAANGNTSTERWLIGPSFSPFFASMISVSFSYFKMTFFLVHHVHLCESPRVVKAAETECRRKGARGGRCCFTGLQFQFGKMRKLGRWTVVQATERCERTRHCCTEHAKTVKAGTP